MIAFKRARMNRRFIGLPPRPRNNRGRRVIYRKLLSPRLIGHASLAYLKHVHLDRKKLPAPRRNQRAIVAEVDVTSACETRQKPLSFSFSLFSLSLSSSKSQGSGNDSKCELETRLEALPVDDGGSRLVVLLLGDPHLLECGERGEDGTADPYGVFPLGRRNDLDLHGRRC